MTILTLTESDSTSPDSSKKMLRTYIAPAETACHHARKWVGVDGSHCDGKFVPAPGAKEVWGCILACGDRIEWVGCSRLVDKHCLSNAFGEAKREHEETCKDFAAIRELRRPCFWFDFPRVDGPTLVEETMRKYGVDRAEAIRIIIVGEWSKQVIRDDNGDR